MSVYKQKNLLLFLAFFLINYFFLMNLQRVAQSEERNNKATIQDGRIFACAISLRVLPIVLH